MVTKAKSWLGFGGKDPEIIISFLVSKPACAPVLLDTP